jgi:uncharacterized protein involved in tolerance to divalent cations
MTKGIIIIGYQGIGKSALGGWSKCIDLESGNFFIGDKRADDWYIPYCQTALNIANQGYTVFVSSHKEVREYLATVPLMENIAIVVVMCPRRTMRDEWIERLQDRYNRTQLHKDYKALMNAKERYDENIAELHNCGLPVIQVGAMDYNLKDYVYMLQQKVKKKQKEG